MQYVVKFYDIYWLTAYVEAVESYLVAFFFNI